jgi:hypothetical protein
VLGQEYNKTAKPPLLDTDKDIFFNSKAPKLAYA